MKKIILASTSSRRRELIKKITTNFEIAPPTFDEKKFNITANPITIEQLSLLKAKSVYVDITVSALIIGADTVVVYEDNIIGKPDSYQEAFSILKKLSGKTHRVITGVSVIDTDTKSEYSNHEVTFVTFNKLSDEDISNYIREKKAV